MKQQQDTSFPDKLLKKLPEGFTDTANGMKDEELKRLIFQAESNIYTIEKEKDDDEKLNGARELAKELSAPYRDAKSCQNAKIKYALWLLEGRGVSLDSRDRD